MPGSYWIYKNTQTGDLDTQTVLSFYFDSLISRGSEPYSRHITIKYDKLQRTIKSSFNNWIYYDETSRYFADATPLKGLFYALGREATGGYISAFHYPFNNDLFSGTGAEKISFMGIDTVLEIQEKTYFNVVKFDVDLDAIWEMKLNCKRPNTIYFWAKGVGLVKKQMNRCNYSWELVAYNIIK
jgi:hypothetical protein